MLGNSSSEILGAIVAYILFAILIFAVLYFLGWDFYIALGFAFFFFIVSLLGTSIEKWMNDSYKCDFWLDSCSTLAFFGFLVLFAIITFGFLFLGYCGLAAGNIYILFTAFVLVFLLFLIFSVISNRRVRHNHENKNK